jgi:hypothetical protein
MISKIYRIYIPSSHIMVESVHVKFNECTNKEAKECIEILGIEVPHVKEAKTEQRLIKIDRLPE